MPKILKKGNAIQSCVRQSIENIFANCGSPVHARGYIGVSRVLSIAGPSSVAILSRVNARDATTNKALIVWGGWDDHQPAEVAALCAKILAEEGFEVEVSQTLETLSDREKLKSLKLLVPVWTMGKISAEQCNAVLEAVRDGMGLAGCHGGMCDAFRENTDWQFMTGGQWVAHPGNEFRYAVTIGPERHLITEGISDFEVETEQYYLHVDPAVKVLATTRFPTFDGPHAANGPVEMPVIWTKFWGRGRVYFNALGHTAKVLEQEPVKTLLRRGLVWAGTL